MFFKSIKLTVGADFAASSSFIVTVSVFLSDLLEGIVAISVFFFDDEDEPPPPPPPPPPELPPDDVCFSLYSTFISVSTSILNLY